MKFLIGKKLNMTQVWQGDEVVAVTRVQVGPCPIVQIKTKDKDGYESVQVGFGERKEKNVKKPQKGHLKDIKTTPFRLREFRVDGKDLKKGDIIDINTFSVGDIIDVIGTSKGRGFQGPVKRYGFHGHNKTHGTKDQVRMPGSIGATGPAHVFKGTRMAGHMGDDRVTTKNLKVIEIDEANNIISIMGAVPGARNSLVMMQGKGELKIKAQAEEIKKETEEEKKEEKVEDKKVENKTEGKKEEAPAEPAQVKSEEAEVKKEEPAEEKKEEKKD